jgi:hypothetical protein
MPRPAPVMSHTFLLVMLSPELCALYRTEDSCPRQILRMKNGNELPSTP